jgi:hypothetical protein
MEGNFSSITIDGQSWVRVFDPRRRAGIDEWIAYADKLEAALELACGQSKDRLMKFHAEQGLRLVRPTALNADHHGGPNGMERR